MKTGICWRCSSRGWLDTSLISRLVIGPNLRRCGHPVLAGGGLRRRRELGMFTGGREGQLSTQSEHPSDVRLKLGKVSRLLSLEFATCRLVSRAMSP